MFQGSGPGSSNQTSALGMHSLQVGPMGSPTNRMETGGDPGLAERQRQENDRGVAGNSGAAMQANAQGAAVTVTQATTPAQSLVGQAGSSVGNAQHILPQQAFGSYGPVRGGLMDPRNYGMNQQLLGTQGPAACGGCGACQGFQGFYGVTGQGQGLTGTGQNLPGQGCMGTAGQGTQACTGRSQEPGSGGACHGPCVPGHWNARTRTGWRPMHGTGCWRVDSSEPKVTGRAEADGRFRTDAVVACQASTW